MSDDQQQQIFALPDDAPSHWDSRYLVDVVVLTDVEVFLTELCRLSGRMEVIVDRLADIIVAAGSPGGDDPAVRAYVVGLLAAEVARRRRHPGRRPERCRPGPSGLLQASEQHRSLVANLREVVTADLFDRQAELETCLDPLIGGGALTRRAAGLLLAMIVPAASRVRPDGRAPLSWSGIDLSEQELCHLGEPLLGVNIAGHETFRLVRGGDLARNRLPACPRIIWNLLELARVTSLSGDHGLVVVPHLDGTDELAEVA